MSGIPDREKVIKGLHDARRYLEDKEWSDRSASPHIDAINDAITLLKEQEAVEPFHKCIGENYTLIEDSGFVFCPYCGKPIVDTEGR